jgi:hypothetical protein
MEKIQLPDNLMGRSLHAKVIPTVCTVKNMIKSLIEVNEDVSLLKPWELRSFKAYRIDEIRNKIMVVPEYKRKEIIREHILSKRPSHFGASVIDIYLVAFVAETYGSGKDKFFKYIFDSGITLNVNSAQAIWQVGKGDGVYLGILNDDGTVRDWDFIKKWIGIKTD